MDPSALIQTRRLIIQGLRAGLYPAPPLRSADPKTVKLFVRILTSEMAGRDDLPPSVQRSLEEAVAASRQGSALRTAATESPTTKDDDQLVFHADFAIPTSTNDIILRAEDGTCFHATFADLSAVSGFFQELAQMDHMVWTKHQIIDLPSSTALGIRTLLCLVDQDRSISWLLSQPHSDIYDSSTFNALGDLYKIIDMYRFDSLARKMVWKFGDEPFALLALAVSAQDVPLPATRRVSDIQSLRLPVQRQIVSDNLNPANMPPGVRRLLQRAAPDYLLRIFEQYTNRALWWGTLELALKVGQPIGGYDDFAVNCKKKGCVSYKAYKNKWTQMRVQAADATIEFIMKHKTFFPPDLGLSKVVECDSCRARLTQAFVAAMKKQHARGWTWNLEEGK